MDCYFCLKGSQKECGVLHLYYTCLERVNRCLPYLTYIRVSMLPYEEQERELEFRLLSWYLKIDLLLTETD